MIAEDNIRNSFQTDFDVSRETIERLFVFERLLRKWNPAINLVAKSTLSGIWSRHFLDSAQLTTLPTRGDGHWVDIGTGGGFPGLVVAAIAAEKSPKMQFSFVESDLRKATFLQSATREMGLTVEIIAQRAEALECLNANIVSARALAPLTELLGLVDLHLTPCGEALLMKGATYQRDIDMARESWDFNLKKHHSVTDKEGVILRIGDIRRV